MTRYIGILEEKTFGVNPETSTNKPFFVNAGSCSLDAASDTYMDIPTIEETPRRAKKGFYSPEGDMEQMLDLVTAPYFLRALFGGYDYAKKNTSGTKPSAPIPDIRNLNAHFMWVLPGRSLPSYTFYVGKENSVDSAFEHMFNGCVVSSGSLEISDDLAQYNISLNVQKDKENPIRPDSEISVSDEYPLAFYETYLDRGERGTVDDHGASSVTWTEVSADTRSFNFELDNGADAESGKGLGSMFTRRILAGTKEPSVSTTMEFTGPQYLRRFWGRDPDTPVPAGDLAGETGKTHYYAYRLRAQDENNNFMEMYFPKVYLKSVSQPMEGSDLIEQELELGVLKDTIFYRRHDSTSADDKKYINTSCLVTVYNNQEEIKRPE